MVVAPEDDAENVKWQNDMKALITSEYLVSLPVILVEINNKIDSLSLKEKNLIKHEEQIRNKEFELNDITEQKVSELEKITNLSLEDAKNQLISEAEIQSKEEIEKRIRDLRKQMESAAKALDFIEAARLRDEITLLKEKI